MRTGTSGLITLAIPSLAGTYFSELAQAFADEAQRRRRSIMLHSTAGGREEEHSVLAVPRGCSATASCSNPLLIGEDRLAHLGRTILPTVFIGERVEEAGLRRQWLVGTDDGGAAREATAPAGPGATPRAPSRRLDSSRPSGRLRQPVQVGSDSSARAAGGVSPVIQTVPGWNQEGGLEAVRTLLQEHPEVDAIVCGNDNLRRGPLGLRDRESTCARSR